MANIFMLILIAFGGTFRNRMDHPLPSTIQDTIRLSIQSKTYVL